MAYYRKRKNGKWQARIKVDGKEKSKSGFLTKTDAKLWAEDYESRLKNNPQYNENITLYEYAKEWYHTFKKPNLAPNTQKRYDTLLKAVKELYKGTRLVDVTTRMYQDKLNEYGETRTKETVKKLHWMLRDCFSRAEYQGDIHKTPVFDIAINGKDSQETLKYLNGFEARKLRQALLDGFQPRMAGRSLCLFALATGVRVGEGMALRDKDLDLENNYVYISHTYDYKNTDSLKDTKNKTSKRKIYIDDETADMLYQLESYQKNRARKLEVIPTDLFIFASKNFEPVSTTGANKALSKACKRAGVPQITFHGLRHTHASILIYEGVPIQYVSQRLGHSKISTTMDIYQHLIREIEEQGNKKIEDILNQTSSRGQKGVIEL